MPNDSIFEADELEAEAQAPEAEAPPASEGPERDEHGRFKPKETPEDEPPAADAPPAEAEDDAGRTVPQGALHAEREKRKASDARATQLEQELTAARETLANIQRMREAAAAKKPEPLPAVDDPAAMEHLRARLEEQGQQLTQFSQRQEFEAADNAEAEQLGAVMNSSEVEFRQTTPDYDDAINHLVQARAQELTEYGYQPAQIQQVLRQEVTEIVRTAVQLGKNPAEMGYKIAQSRGYRPAQAQPAANGAQATLDAIARAQGASKSLGGGAGSTPQTLNAAAIARMTDDEFAQLYSTTEGRALIDGL